MNGQTYYTCEAMVLAIKGDLTRPVELLAMRPLALKTWCERLVVLSAGQQHSVNMQA